MNINRLYLAAINIVAKVEYIGDISNYYGKFCKNTIVYHDERNEYIDLKSGEKYKKGLDDVFNSGDMYIDFRKDLIPLTEIQELNFKKEDMSRRKILKKLSNTSLYNKKEEDK